MPAVATGRILVDAMEAEVEIRDPMRRPVEPGAVPEGTYTIYARFGDTAMDRILEFQLHAGQLVRVKCNGATSTCRAE